MPQDYPSQYGRSDAYSNPEGTIPFPPPASTSWPAPQWFTQAIPFGWTLTGTIDGTDPNSPFPTGFLYNWNWSTPVFDLRPDLRSGNASPKDGVPMLPKSARLMVQLKQSSNSSGALGVLNTSGLTVQAVDYSNNVTNYSSDRRLNDAPPVTGGAGLLPANPINVTSQFTATGTALALLAGFAPPGTNLGGGDGYPVRFWRLELRFQILVPSLLPLPLVPLQPRKYVLQGSMY